MGARRGRNVLATIRARKIDRRKNEESITPFKAGPTGSHNQAVSDVALRSGRLPRSTDACSTSAMAFNIADLFEYVSDVVPDRIALIADDGRRTFAELDERSNRFAHHLLSSGHRPGDHVGIHALNSAEWVEAMYGCYKARAVPINVNFRYVEDELRYLYDNADLVAVVHDRDFSPRIAHIRDEIDTLRHLVVVDDGTDTDLSGLDSVPYDEALAAASPDRDFAPRSADDLYILYTGGTTGMPKGVMWRQEDVIFALGGGIDALTGQRATHDHELAEQAAASGGPIDVPRARPDDARRLPVGRHGPGVRRQRHRAHGPLLARAALARRSSARGSTRSSSPVTRWDVR